MDPKWWSLKHLEIFSRIHKAYFFLFPVFQHKCCYFEAKFNEILWEIMDSNCWIAQAVEYLFAFKANEIFLTTTGANKWWKKIWKHRKLRIGIKWMEENKIVESIYKFDENMCFFLYMNNVNLWWKYIYVCGVHCVDVCVWKKFGLKKMHLDKLVFRPFLQTDDCVVFFDCCVRRIIQRSNCSSSISFIIWRSRKSGFSSKYAVTCSADKSKKKEENK